MKRYDNLQKNEEMKTSKSNFDTKRASNNFTTQMENQQKKDTKIENKSKLIKIIDDQPKDENENFYT